MINHLTAWEFDQCPRDPPVGSHLGAALPTHPTPLATLGESLRRGLIFHSSQNIGRFHTTYIMLEKYHFPLVTQAQYVNCTTPAMAEERSNPLRVSPDRANLAFTLSRISNWRYLFFIGLKYICLWYCYNVDFICHVLLCQLYENRIKGSLCLFVYLTLVKHIRGLLLTHCVTPKSYLISMNLSSSSIKWG